jgi:hypothetical protein
MPEIKNTFLRSKMNKDLDARIIPNGEYRDGQNISISSSEGASVGALENIRGNKLLTNFGLTDFNLEVIGNYVDTANNRIFFFITNFSDASTNSLRNLSEQGGSATENTYTFQKNGGANYICYCELPSESSQNINTSNIKFKVILTGTFLNFSKTHPILSINLIEDLLFWTDNRNQPRKINVKTAIANPLTYYTHEDHISVAKYAPYSSISFLDTIYGEVKSTLKNEVDEWLPPFFGAPGQVLNQTHDVLIFDERNAAPNTSYTNIAAHLGSGVPSIDIRIININDEDNVYALVQNIDTSTNPASVFIKTIDGVAVTDIPSQLGWDNSGIFMFQIKNPDYRPSFNGDKDLLKEKFVRFSYRFKYDDDEYSLTAPFSQHAFVPEQYGYFTQLDDEKTKSSSIVDFMQNQITTAGLVIDLPYSVTEVENKLKLKEIQLLYKTSDEENLKVIADVDVKDLKSTVSTVTIKEAGSNYTAGTYTNVILDTNGAVKGTIVVNGAGRVSSAVITSSNNGYSIGQEFSVPALGGPPTGSGAVLTVASLGSKYVYNYTSQKPTKVLPEKEIVRVSDIVPMRAATQEVVGNRIIYGNFLQNNKSLEKLDYSLGKVNKGDSTTNINKEFLNHTLKQGRSYQVGIVLQDRYGRASNVIVNDASNSSTNLTSTIFSSYTNGGTNPLTWPGDSLQVSFNEPIPTEKKDDYNGTWVENVNPLGWYTYKVVVQQKEQDYYNIYTAGALTGNVIYSGAILNNTATPLTYSEDSSVSHIALFNDNINKVPRELEKVGPSDNVYSSSTVLFNRVKQLNYSTTAGFTFINQQNSSPKKIEITTVRPFIEMGDWTTKKNINLYYTNATTSGSTFTSQYVDPTYIYPGPEGNIDPLYLNNNKNPLVATLKTKNRLGFKGSDQGASTYKFAKDLMVFETKPFKSNLDIYYETSTSGKIQDLNTSIANSITDFSSKAPHDISEFLTTGFLESSTVGSTITNVFQVVNQNLTPVQDVSANVIIEEVKDGNGVVITPPFNISQVSAPSAPSTAATFKLVAATRIAFIADSDINNNYTIKFRLSVDGFPDVLVDKGIELTNVKPKIYRISKVVNQQAYPGIYGSLIKNTGIQPFLNTNGNFPALTDLDTNNPQPFNPAVSWSGEYAITYEKRALVNFKTDGGDFKYPVADISHTSNGYDSLSLPYDENNFNRFPVSSTPRLQGLTYKIKSAIRYNAYAYLDFYQSNAIAYYMSVANAQDTAIDKSFNFVIDTSNSSGRATLSFTIPGGGKISKSELPNNRPGDNRYKGSWLYDVIIDVTDASGSTGNKTSDEYHVQFLITK